MSGGTFQHMQRTIREIAGEYAEELRAMRSRLAPDVVAELEKGLLVLLQAYAYAQRADWLFAYDDGGESYLSRLEEDLARAQEDHARMISDAPSWRRVADLEE
jgi:hypothetical protein